MQTNVSYRNVLFAYANRTPSKQKFSGIQHNFKQMCGTASFVGLDIFNPPESVPHIHFGFHAEALLRVLLWWKIFFDLCTIVDVIY